MNELFCIVNGEYVSLNQASLSVADLAVQRGYGVFDFFRLQDGKPVFWDEHLDRLERSCNEFRLSIDRAVLLRSLQELIERNNLASAGIRITVTGGNSRDGYSISTPNVVIVQQPLVLLPPTPVRLITYQHQRQLPHVKSIDYTMAIYLRKQVKDQGADEVLYHSGGVLRECPRANVFVVTANGMLVTPSHDVLAGITRRHVLKLATGLAHMVERDVTIAELRDAREAFITSTSRKIVPIAEIDRQRIGDGNAGPVTRALMSRFDDFLA
jgi:branched-chain amino acid aminotransferase